MNSDRDPDMSMSLLQAPESTFEFPAVTGERWVWWVFWGRGGSCPGPGRGGVGMSLPHVSSRIWGHIVLFSPDSQPAAS